MVMTLIYTIVGEYDNALDEIDYLLSMPSNSSANFIEVEPVYAPLRTMPRYKEIVKKYSTIN